MRNRSNTLQRALFLGFFCLPWFGFALVAPKSPAVIRVVYYSYPPHVIVGPQGLTGASVEVWNRITKRAGLKIEWIGPIPFRRAQYMVEMGDADAVVRLSKTPEREKTFIFSEKAPMWGEQGIIVLKTEPLDEIHKPEELFGKNLGMLDGGILPDFIKPHIGKIVLDPIPIDSVELNMRKLFSHRIWGAYFAFSDVGRYYAAKNHRESDVKLLRYPGSDGHLFSYIAMSRKSDPALVKKMQTAINAEVGHYDYVKMARKYIDEAQKKSPIQELK